ncbi:MAG: heat-inducible transcription repressor HrcA [Hydrogenibacillus schlegelii]|nr:heat-inducible transcription repressor HrcA [Hydrogenibacillus schlegelii]
MAVLTERQRAILQAVVENYIRSAEPVGSRTIARLTGLNLSPATIRNEMADLEAMGYLEQPHTSAGRIPSYKGYRYYVDHLLTPEAIDRSWVEALERRFYARSVEIEEALRKTAAILAELTHYAVVALGPEVFTARLVKLEFVPLDEARAVTVLVTDTGHVEHKVVELPQGLSTEDLAHLVERINAELKGTAISTLAPKIHRLLAQAMESNREALFRAERFFEALLHPREEARLIVDGTTEIIAQPEFRSVDRVRELLKLFEAEEPLFTVLRQVEDGVQVHIGLEDVLGLGSPLSLVTATLTVGEGQRTTIGIIGPPRMDYAKAIGLLSALSFIFDAWRERGLG